MDLSRSFVALSREFQFLINFLADKHWELTSAPATIKSNSKDLAAHLQALREIATILVEEQCAWHCEFINARRPNPKVYSLDNIVFARRAVRSDSSRGHVNKLSYTFTVGLLSQIFMVPPMKLNTVPQRNRRSGMRPIFHHIPLSFFPYICPMVLIISTANSIRKYWTIHIV
jgi:hypothetical protein